MRVKKIVVGLAAVLAVAGVAACSSGAAGSSATPQVAVAADVAGQTMSTAKAPATAPHTVQTTTAAKPTTTVPTRPNTTAPALAPAAQATAKPAGVPCSMAATACVDLSTSRAWLLRDGKVIYGPVPVMAGRRGWPTPVGTFHVEYKDINYFSREFQAPMPYAVFFYPGVAFHVGSLRVHSHGCVHLSRSAAVTFFHDLSVGNEVQVVR